MVHTDGGQSPLAVQITALLDARRSRLPDVQAQIARWRAIDQSLTRLEEALNALREHPSIVPETAAGLVVPRLPDLRLQIAKTIELLAAVAARFSRETVNIGVSGSARMGKSTLLQSISGLTDDQIPTGRDLPVTAVRSRIYHSPTLRRAVLRLHSRESFLTEVIHPYHAALRFTGVPADIDEFRTWDYSADPPDATPAQIALLVRLRDIQAALWSYEEDLVGGERVVGLDGLRRYVAYPTHAEQSSAERVERRYLAVRDVRIDCPFPHAEVDRLGIIDLPGLGEIAAGAEKQHVTGLRHDVDAVLVVKRAVEAAAFWTKADGQALNLLDEARGSIRNRGDFVYLVINTPQGAEALAEPLRADILHKVNSDRESRYFTILETDAKDPEAVRRDVLSPLLRTLAARLPVMDAECLAGAQEEAEAALSGLRRLLADVEAALRAVRTTSGDMVESVNLRAAELRREIADGLNELVAALRNRAITEEDDPEYAAAVREVYAQTVEWIQGGFGIGEEKWCEAARKAFVTDGYGGYADHHMHRIRVEIANRFATLDGFFSGQMEQARTQVAEILAQRCGNLLAGVEGGTAVLTELAGRLDNPRNPCPALRNAVLGLLNLRMEYRTHLHPRLRRQLDGLSMHYEDPLTGQPRAAMVPELTAEGARDLYVYFTQQARNAAHEIRKALLEEEFTPAMVVYAAVEHFTDAFIRSGSSDLLHSPGSEREFERFARAYRDELWPGDYEGIAEGDIRYDRVLSAVEELNKQLAELGRPL